METKTINPPDKKVLSVGKYKAIMNPQNDNDGDEVDNVTKQHWNNFVKSPEAAKAAKNPAIDSDKSVGLSAIAEYNRRVPESTLKATPEHVAKIQASINRYKDDANAAINSGKAKVSGDDGSGGGIMRGASKTDGFLGSKTISTPFATAKMVSEGSSKMNVPQLGKQGQVVKKATVTNYGTDTKKLAGY